MVLDADLLVVGGIVVSPFAVSHTVPHAYYGLHRWIHRWMPAAFLGGVIEQDVNVWVGDVTNFLFSKLLTSW